MKEIWKDITYLGNEYRLSNQGKLLDKSSGELKKDFDNGKGYRVFAIWKNNVQHNILVHRLVAEHFLSNPYNLPEVNHKDEDKTNNCADNLEWCTKEYNQKYGTRLQRIKESNLYTSKNKKKVICVETGTVYRGVRDAARGLGKSTHTTIGKACRDNSKTAYGFHWSFVEEV